MKTFLEDQTKESFNFVSKDFFIDGKNCGKNREGGGTTSVPSWTLGVSDFSLLQVPIGISLLSLPCSARAKL